MVVYTDVSEAKVIWLVYDADLVDSGSMTNAQFNVLRRQLPLA